MNNNVNFGFLMDFLAQFAHKLPTEGELKELEHSSVHQNP